MINIIAGSGYKVVREDPSGVCDIQDGIREVGLYETKEEAEFIARKALKMEKSASLSAALKRNPNMKPVKLSSNIINASYNVVYVSLTKGYSPRYTNGVSNVVHHLEELKESRWVDRKVVEVVDGLTFREWAMKREENNSYAR